MTKRFGFTLAEVLITLGIIGVVAAMTMPTLMNSTNGAQYKTAYKKALSVLSQAIVLNVALDEWNLADTTGTGTADQSIYALFKGRMNVVRTAAGRNYAITNNGNTGVSGGNIASDTSNYSLFFNDGIMFEFKNGDKACTKDDTVGTVNVCKGLIDVNGQKNPNKLVACEGDTSGDDCKVTNPTDVYPVVFYDQQILPATDAARAVLYAK